MRDSLGQLQDVVTRLANASFQRMDNLENKVSSLVDAQIKTEESLVNLDGKVSSLIDAQIKTEEKLGVLVQTQGNTDKRLDALMTMFERYISKDQNGNSQS